MSYLLDTNVLSETVKPNPDDRVVDWVRHCNPSDIFLSALTIGELIRGVHKLPASRRRRRLEQWIDLELCREFDGRILGFGVGTGRIWGQLMGDGDRLGKTPPQADAQIAATAIEHGLTLVTRNIRDFSTFGLDLLDPWK